jgi:hypothetical protein
MIWTYELNVACFSDGLYGQGVMAHHLVQVHEIPIVKGPSNEIFYIGYFPELTPYGAPS